MTHGGALRGSLYSVHPTHTDRRIQLDRELFELCEHGAEIHVRLGQVEEDAEDGLSRTRIVDHLHDKVTVTISPSHQAGRARKMRDRVCLRKVAHCPI